MHTQNRVEVNVIEIWTKRSEIKERYEKHEKLCGSGCFFYFLLNIYIQKNIYCTKCYFTIKINKKKVKKYLYIHHWRAEQK